MVIELLKVKIPPELREKCIQKDAEIWTAALAKYPGFMGKEVWINPNDPTEVVLIINSLANSRTLARYTQSRFASDRF